jgi:hypothetical protein
VRVQSMTAGSERGNTLFNRLKRGAVNERREAETGPNRRQRSEFPGIQNQRMTEAVIRLTQEAPVGTLVATRLQ